MPYCTATEGQGEDKLIQKNKTLQSHVDQLTQKLNEERLENMNLTEEKEKCCMLISTLQQEIKQLKREKNRSKKSIKFLRDVVKAKSHENDLNKEAIQDLMVHTLNLEEIIEKKNNSSQ